MLTSTKNPRIQKIRKLQSSSRYRRESGDFVVEGIRLVEEALKAGCKGQFVLHTEDLNERGQLVIEAFSRQGTETLAVAPHVMQAASDTRSPQGILAVVSERTKHLHSNPDFLLVIDGMRDPGNMGTILRTALGAGVDGVLVPPGSVDYSAPKVLRAGMGAHFRLAIHPMSWEAIHALGESGKFTIFLADSDQGQPYTQADFRSPLMLIIGGEASGPGLEAQQISGQRVHIPMPGEIESLNASAAAAILLFEVRRQRNLK